MRKCGGGGMAGEAILWGMKSVCGSFLKGGMLGWIMGMSIMAVACATDTNKPAAGKKPEGGVEKAGEYIVVSLVGKTNTTGCQIIPKGNFYAAIYRKSFGPASYKECESWVRENCKESEKGKGPGGKK